LGRWPFLHFETPLTHENGHGHVIGHFGNSLVP
jgi:hypothetical protein